MSEAGKIEIKISAKTKYPPGTGPRWKVAMWLIDLGCRLAKTEVTLETDINGSKYPIGKIWKGKKREQR